MRDGGAESGQQEQTGEEAGARAVVCQFSFQTLHSTSQDGLDLEFVSATAVRECNIQDARGGGLCGISVRLHLIKSSLKYYLIFKFLMLD